MCENFFEIEGFWFVVGMSLVVFFGIVVGFLLNGKWCEYYVLLGFDWVIYKMVWSKC